MSETDSRTGTVGDLDDIVLAIWREVLGVEDAGPDDNFFDLGGDSFVATRLVVRLGDELGIPVSMLAVFENPTAGELALELALELTRD
ncbi:MAG: phosphopantetheine-binding protein [Frankiaceae bacterium]